MVEKVCKMEGCDRGGKLTRGMCAKDYRYWLDHTPPDRRGLAPRAARRFDDFVDRSSGGGCWTWTGPCDRGGYGRWGKKLAHRLALAAAQGPIPAGKMALHRCDNPPCVNPKHLYVGTASDNMRDALARGQHPGTPLKNTTHCRKGHELTGANLEITGRDRSRRCRICENERAAAWQRQMRRKRGLRKTRVTDEEKARMIELHAAGNSHRAIAAITGRAFCTVGDILREARSARTP
jgi:hypothetical protein